MTRKRPKIGQTVPHVLSLQPGDFVRIPLPGTVSAYGRVYRDATIGIFVWLSSDAAPEQLLSASVAFHVGFFCTPAQRRDFDWVYLGNVPFENEDDSWPIPRYIEDIVVPGTYCIYDRGNMRPASPAEIAGLQQQIMMSPEALRQRILQESRNW